MRDYYRSAEGKAAYKTINMPYPEEPWDAAYDKFLKLTKNTKEKDVKREIHNMKRLILESGESYIIHDMTETRFDPLGNVKTFQR
jgi:hypothetical protein